MRGTQSYPWRPPHSGLGFPLKTEAQLISQPFTRCLLALKDKGCPRPGHKHCPRSEVSGGDVFENLLFPTVRAVSAFPGPPRRGTETGHMHPLDLLGPWGAHWVACPSGWPGILDSSSPGLIPSAAQLPPGCPIHPSPSPPVNNRKSVVCTIVHFKNKDSIGLKIPKLRFSNDYLHHSASVLVPFSSFSSSSGVTVFQNIYFLCCPCCLVAS